MPHKLLLIINDENSELSLAINEVLAPKYFIVMSYGVDGGSEITFKTNSKEELFKRYKADFRSCGSIDGVSVSIQTKEGGFAAGDMNEVKKYIDSLK